MSNVKKIKIRGKIIGTQSTQDVLYVLSSINEYPNLEKIVTEVKKEGNEFIMTENPLIADHEIYAAKDHIISIKRNKERTRAYDEIYIISGGNKTLIPNPPNEGFLGKDEKPWETERDVYTLYFDSTVYNSNDQNFSYVLYKETLCTTYGSHYKSCQRSYKYTLLKITANSITEIPLPENEFDLYWGYYDHRPYMRLDLAGDKWILEQRTFPERENGNVRLFEIKDDVILELYNGRESDFLGIHGSTSDFYIVNDNLVGIFRKTYPLGTLFTVKNGTAINLHDQQIAYLGISGDYLYCSKRLEEWAGAGPKNHDLYRTNGEVFEKVAIEFDWTGRGFVFNNILFLVDMNGDTWSLQLNEDGSTGRTEIVKEDFSMGSGAEYNDKYYFEGTTLKTGVELFVAESNRIELVEDINPGEGSSHPFAYSGHFNFLTGESYFDTFKTNDTLYLTGFDGEKYNLYALSEQNKRYLTFSGGGWNTHSFLAGIIGGGMDAMEEGGSKPKRALEAMMENIEGIGAISGGSWFLSHLMYSRKFNRSFNSKLKRDKYLSKGYLGRLEKNLQGVIDIELNPIFKRSIRLLKKVLEKETIDEIKYIAKVATFLNEEEFSWRSFVENLVYKPLGMLEELSGKNLASDRLPWANDIDFNIATAITTSDTVLRQHEATAGKNRVFGHANAILKNAQARPLGLRSVVEENKISATGDIPVGNNLKLKFENDQLLGQEEKKLSLDASFGIPISEELSIIDATVASSSALSALAQPKAFYLPRFATKYLSSIFKELSPMASFLDNGALELDIPNKSVMDSTFEESFESVQKNGLVRLMDGGYVDNAPAAFILRDIQRDIGINQSFDLTMFFNSSYDPITEGVKVNTGDSVIEMSDFVLPQDLAQLFGRTISDELSNPGTLVHGPFPKLKNNMPSPQIFSEDSWNGETKPEWSYEKGSVEIRYFDLDVTTVRNKQFGVEGGQKGRVRLFTANNHESFAAPVRKKFFGEYKNNFSYARDAFSQGEGSELLLDALGIEAMN